MKITIILLTLAISGLCDNQIDKVDNEIDQLANPSDNEIDQFDNQIDQFDNQIDQLDNEIDNEIDQLDDVPEDDEVSASKEVESGGSATCRRKIKFGRLCSSSCRNVFRGKDRYGSGKYGSRRGCKRHVGVDIRCRDGSKVYAPFSGRIIGRARVHGRYRALNYGLVLRTRGVIVELHHIRPIKVCGRVRKGQLIGYMLRMQCYYPGITSHVHVQMRNKRNPSRYFRF